MFTLVKWRDISSLLPAIKTRNKALGRCCRELSWPGGKATTYTALGMTKTIAITITNKHTHTRQSDNNGNNGDKRINKGCKMNIAPLDAMTIPYWKEDEEWEGRRGSG